MSEDSAVSSQMQEVVVIELKGHHSFRRISLADLPPIINKLWQIVARDGVPMRVLVDFPEARGMLTAPWARGGPSAILYVETLPEHEARARERLRAEQLIE